MAPLVKILAGIGTVIFLIKGGGAAVMGGLRYLWPVALAYLGFIAAKKLLAAKPPPSQHGGSDTVIEICPDCGTQKSRGHRCIK